MQQQAQTPNIMDALNKVDAILRDIAEKRFAKVPVEDIAAEYETTTDAVDHIYRLWYKQKAAESGVEAIRGFF